MTMNVSMPHFAAASRPNAIQYQATAKSAAASAPAEVKFKGTQESSGIVVQHSAMVEKDPDTMAVQMQLRQEGPTERAVNDALHTRSAAAVEAIKALNIPGLVMKTSFQPVYPNYDYSGNRKQPRINGYYGSFSIGVQVKNSTADALPEAAAKLKQLATDKELSFNGPQYGLSNQEEALLEALEKAIKEAKVRAERLARAGGIQLEDKPHSIEIGASDPYAGGGYRGGARAMALAASADNAASAESFQYAPIQISSPNIVVRFNKKRATASRAAKADQAE